MLLTTGELADFAAKKVAKVGFFDKGVNGLGALVDAREEFEDFCDAIVTRKRTRLKNDTDQSAADCFFGAHAENFNASAICLLKAKNDVNCCAFSSAISAKESNDFTGINAQVHALECVHIPVGLHQVFRKDHWGRGLSVRVHALSQACEGHRQQCRFYEVSHDNCHEAADAGEI